MNPIFPVTERDWTEDFPSENGNYGHTCRDCNLEFTGHKRRLPICKKCSAIAKAKWDTLTPEQQAKESDRIYAEVKKIFANFK